jgi:hypothetical protein
MRKNRGRLPLIIQRGNRGVGLTPSPPPGPREQAAVGNAQARVRGRKKRIQIDEKRENGKLEMGPSDVPGYYNRLLDAFETDSSAFAEAEVLRLSKGLGRNNQSPADNNTLNAALAVVDGTSPENEVEAMLASQMAMTMLSPCRQ